MKSIDPNSDRDYDIYYRDSENGSKVFWGTYKNIPEEKVNTIYGKLGSYLHMKAGLRLGVENDPWYIEARTFLDKTEKFLAERIENSLPYFSYADIENYELIEKSSFNEQR